MLFVLALMAADPVPDAPRSNPEAAREAARVALDAGRFCDALFYDQGVFRLSGKTSALYNAAEDAFAAGDLAQALVLYQEVKERDVEGKLRPAQVKARVTELRERISQEGPGQRCKPPRALCGNGIIEGAEVCDDANADNADGCLATCSAPTAAAPAASPPLMAAPAPSLVVGATIHPPEPPPAAVTPEPEPPVLPWALATGGALAASAGVVAVILGAQPLLTFQSTDAQLRQLELANAEPGGLPARQAQAKADFESWGAPLLIGGIVLGVVGVVGVGAGTVLLLE